MVEIIRQVIEWVALGIEVLAVAVIVSTVVVVAVTRGTVRYLFQLGTPGAYARYKQQLGSGLLLGLDLLVAGDVVKTVVLEADLNSVAALGLLVLVRTFLSWAMIVEMEGRWPWQPGGQMTNRSAEPGRVERPV